MYADPLFVAAEVAYRKERLTAPGPSRAAASRGARARGGPGACT